MVAVTAAVIQRKLFSRFWNPVLAGCLISSQGHGTKQVGYAKLFWKNTLLNYEAIE